MESNLVEYFFLIIIIKIFKCNFRLYDDYQCIVNYGWFYKLASHIIKRFLLANPLVRIFFVFGKID